MRPKLILVVVLALLLGIFVLQNTAVVEVRFLFWKVEMSRALMLFAVLLAGGLLGWLVATIRHRP